MTTQVIHIKDSLNTITEVYIGRGSKWGNPFRIGRDGTREEVISKYEACIMERSDLLDALGELRGKVLVCFCKPSACHGDVLARLADDEVDLK